MWRMTPDQAWREFLLSVPTRIAPACRCEACGARVPEREAVWHAEELAQMREEFLRALETVRAAQHPSLDGPR